MTQRGAIIKRVALAVAVAVATFALVYFVYLGSGIAGGGAAGEAVSGAQAAVDSVKDRLSRNVRNDAFGVGEKLRFDINYGFINAGSATMEILGPVEWNERACYQIRTLAQSNSFFTSIFPVNDTVTSILDGVGLCSWLFDKRLKEGSYKAQQVYHFDQIDHKVIFKGDTFSVEPFAQDPLSVMYFVRTLDLTVGSSVFVPSFADGKAKPLEVKALRRETIEVEAGTFKCIVVEPLLYAAGIFKHEGKLTVWLTDDRLRMPVMMKSKVLVGAITAELTEYELGEIQEF